MLCITQTNIVNLHDSYFVAQCNNDRTNFPPFHNPLDKITSENNLFGNKSHYRSHVLKDVSQHRRGPDVPQLCFLEHHPSKQSEDGATICSL